MLAAVGLGAALWFGMSGGGGYTGPEQQAPNYQKHQTVAATASAGIAKADLDAKLSRIAKNAAEEGKPIPELPPDQPRGLLREVRGGNVEFYSITLYDDCAEDGDVVAVRVGSGDTGITYGPIPILHKGQTLKIPVIGGQPPTVILQAVKDGGGGGVTAAIQTSDGVWLSQVLPEGASERIPVALK